MMYPSMLGALKNECGVCRYLGGPRAGQDQKVGLASSCMHSSDSPVVWVNKVGTFGISFALITG